MSKSGPDLLLALDAESEFEVGAAALPTIPPAAPSTAQALPTAPTFFQPDLFMLPP